MSTQICLWITLALFLATGGSETIYEKHGKPVSLACAGAVPNKDVEWKHNDALIMSVKGKDGRSVKGKTHLSSKARIISTSLSIPSLAPSDSGSFSCIGYDKDNNKVTRQHSLYVVSASDNTDAVVNSDVALKCRIAGGSTAVVHWLRPSLQHHSTGQEMTLKRVSLEDSGKWTCQIKEENKEIMKTEMDVTVVGLLESAKELIVPQGGDAELPCGLSRSSRLPIVKGGWVRKSSNNYLLTLNTVNGLHWNISSNENHRFKFQTQPLSTNFSVKLTNVQPADNDAYVCSLTFNNQNELSTSLILRVEGTVVSTSWSNAEGISALVGSWWVWIAIAVSSAFLITLVVVIVMFHRRNKRMKRKVRKLKSLRQPLTPRTYCQCNSTERQPHAGRKNRPAPLPRGEYYPIDN